jgi:hypothetical protein
MELLTKLAARRHFVHTRILQQKVTMCPLARPRSSNRSVTDLDTWGLL